MAVRERHQGGTQNNKPVWADRTMRLDPYALPQKMSYNRQAKTAKRRPFEFTLDRFGAVLKCDLDCGLPLSMSLPRQIFRGVAARAYQNRDGSSTVTLELMHADPQLSIPLCVSDDMENAAADWHSWSNMLALPMLMVDEAGAVTVVKDPTGPAMYPPRPRRRRRAFMVRRPNFLRRRKPGMIGPVVRIAADEIIARN